MTLSLDVIKVIPAVIRLLPVPLAGLQEFDLLTYFVPAVWHRTCISHPWQCDQLIHLSLKNYREIPCCVQGRYDCLYWWKLRIQKNRRTGCLVNTYITKQAPEEEAGADEGEKEKRGFFSLLNSSHSQTLEAPVWAVRWFHPYAPCLLKRNKELRICHMSLHCSAEARLHLLQRIGTDVLSVALFS